MAAKFVPHLQKTLIRHKIFKLSFKIRHVYTPRVSTSVYMYWVPVIHRLYIPQLNIFNTRYYFWKKTVVYSDQHVKMSNNTISIYIGSTHAI